MKRSLTRLAAACVVGLAILTGCSGEPGTPSPGSTTETEVSTSTAGSTGSNDNTLAGIKPCDLLTSSEATSLALASPGEADRVGGADACDWAESGNGGLIVGVNPTRGLKDLNYEGETTFPTKISKYEATRVEAHNGSKSICHVVISVSDSSSVQVIGTLKATSTDTAAACDRATRAAELIAPKLP
ncbi:hypothetical protein ALI22I_00390 [Saccharothrix sp. ALI-22-I]|uniref:DUF3558 family protein n=1 Tax=Saccharothrix sp. ALI-22-I TaxID=1933778 RepID=UPI0009D5B606|nr:DUF3558 family protein [Saccharothrix sp. ALI-22-I]ONI93040.1 hypothetical protein ALI22I_00390 [Saccharothrix sp. ALI-22-I]